MSAHLLPLHSSKPQWFIMPFLLLCILFSSLIPQANAQPDPRALDPADVFFQAWLTIRDAEKLEQEKKYSDAWRKYRQAANYYDSLSRYHKNWKPHLVKGRIETTNAAIKAIEPKAATEIAGKKIKTADLIEGGTEPDAQGRGSGNAIIPRTPSAPNPADKDVQRRLQILETDNNRLRQKLNEELNKGAAKGDTVTQKRLAEQISKRTREINTLRNILARAPLQKDMDSLERRNRTVAAELDITARVLKETQKKHLQVIKEMQKHKDNAELAQKRAEEIQEDMDAQKKIDNEVVTELRKELTSVTKMLDNTRRELGVANANATRIERALLEAKTTITELTEERNDLLTERDTLHSILKRDGSAGVQKLIAENVRLGKELKDSTARLKFLKLDNDATKDELTEAKRDLAVAKNRIMTYQQNSYSNTIRIKTLERQLRDSEADLLTGRDNNGSSPAANRVKSEENDILRSTVKRLIATQERQRTASKILWETYTKSKIKIPGFENMIDDIRNAKVELTQEEKGLVTQRRPDREFRSPDRVSLTHARTHATELEKEIARYDPSVKRAFEKGRFEAARQILEDMDERFPGHFPTLCNRGVVELNTADYQKAAEFFNEAITMRENSSYAHHMLGFTRYEQQEADAARNSFQRSLDLRPNNAQAHLYLGILAGKAARSEQATQHFLTALKLDPTLAEAYFNLSVVYLQDQNKKEATAYYTKAIDNGLPPNPQHELRLTN